MSFKTLCSPATPFLPFHSSSVSSVCCLKCLLCKNWPPFLTRESSGFNRALWVGDSQVSWHPASKSLTRSRRHIAGASALAFLLLFFLPHLRTQSADSLCPFCFALSSPSLPLSVFPVLALSFLQYCSWDPLPAATHSKGIPGLLNSLSFF